MPLKITCINRNTKRLMVPIWTGRGFCCAKGGNTAAQQTFVRSIDDVYELLREGYSVRMSHSGAGRGNLRTLKGISIMH